MTIGGCFECYVYSKSSLQESANGKLHSKQSSNEPSPENFMTIGGCFERYMYRVMAPDWLKKKEIRRLTILAFDHFRFVTSK